MRQNTKYSRIGDLLTEGKRILALKNIDSPALDAALLLAETMGLSREKLIIHNDCKADEVQCKRYFDLLERRCSGECTAYILGRKEFWGLEFSVTPAVLVPRPDTEILVKTALAILRSDPYSPLSSTRRILDLCTGSGVVAIALKHECPNLDVWASDISEEALFIARKNAEALGCPITFLQGNLFDLFDKIPQFFFITANAPYVPSANIAFLPAEVKNEPRLALDGGPDGLDLIRLIITEAPLYLQARGNLVLEADPSQMETIAILLKGNGFSEPVLYKDLSGQNRIIAASRREQSPDHK